MKIFHSLRKSFLHDKTRLYLFLGTFVFAWFLSQGLPLFDDDFTTLFRSLHPLSLWQLFLEWISPLSTQPQFWGFYERPIQRLQYKVFYFLFGYDSTMYFLYRDLIYALAVVLIYQWGRRLIPESVSESKKRLFPLMGAIFFLVLPGPVAAHIFHSDVAGIAEFLFLLCTYVLWSEVEKTPREWIGTIQLKNREHLLWLKKWFALSIGVYLCYKSKADLKLIPVILLVYICLARRKQIFFFIWPTTIMGLLAVPWGPGIFSKLPPFLPGSKGSEAGWMWQPASISRFFDFLWVSSPRNWFDPEYYPIALIALAGPFVLYFSFYLIKKNGLTYIRLLKSKADLISPSDRALLFILIWVVLIFIAISALPAINSFYRTRYGIVPMVPFSILVCRILFEFWETCKKIIEVKVSLWAWRIGIILFASQISINLCRSFSFRKDLGSLMNAVHAAYVEIEQKHPTSQIVLYDGFLPYDYKPEAKMFDHKIAVANMNDLAQKNLPRSSTVIISWNAIFAPEVEFIRTFSGCNRKSLYDRLFVCGRLGTSVYLMKYIAISEEYRQAEAAFSKKNYNEAIRLFASVLNLHPGSMPSLFYSGIAAQLGGDLTRAEAFYKRCEELDPKDNRVSYNYGVVLEDSNRIDEALEKFEAVLAQSPNDFGTLYHVVTTNKKAGRKRKALIAYEKLKALYPNNRDVELLDNGDL